MVIRTGLVMRRYDRGNPDAHGKDDALNSSGDLGT
jgi:hypothetical protein